MGQHPRVWRLTAGAAAAYTLVALAITFPLVLTIGTSVPHDLGDPLLSTAVLWWNAHVMPLTDAWWNGPWFYPEPGSLAFSDHRLGGSLIASPLQWAGLGPVAAYNVTLILSFTLCAAAAFALVLALTGRVGAAAIAGLAFGFNPYRMAHVEHLELLMAFGMPLALLALHRYVETRRQRWLLALAGAILLQGLGSSYYLLFFSVFMVLWVVWFLRAREWRVVLALAAVSLAPVAALAPIYLTFADIHRAYNFKRAGYEIAFQSADVTSIVTASPMLAIWGWTSGLNGPEKQTFPGLTIALLALTGAVLAVRARRIVPDRLAHVTRSLWGLAGLVVLVAIAARVWGPFRWEFGPARLSIDVLHKPLSIALLLAIVGLLTSGRLRDAYRRRSLLAFYGLTVAVMFLLSLGHQPRFMGEDILYRPPYAWLMALPGFGSSIRVPARFAMPAVLALSVAGGLSFARLSLRPATARLLAGVCLFGVAADTWPSAFPVPATPTPWQADAIVAGPAAAAVMELPLGGAEYDAAAMYRAAFHGLPTVNGMSGYVTPRYKALARAIGDHDREALLHLSLFGPILIAAAKQDESSQHWAQYVAAAPGVAPAGEDERWRFFRLERRAEAGPPPCGSRVLRPARASDEGGPIDLGPLTDNDPATLRSTKIEQTSNDELTVDFGRELSLCAVGFSLGSLAEDYPRHLQAEASRDGQVWSTVFDGSTAGLALDAALARPLDARVELPMTRQPVRFVRLRLVRTRPADRWVMAELYARIGP